MQIHVIETGRLTGNETFFRGDGWGALLKRPRPVEFPAYQFVIEHPDGTIAIDTGMNAAIRTPRAQRRLVPVPHVAQEAGPAMRAQGLDPDAVTRVVLTHLDWDHAGGLAHFPRAEVLVHRPEYAFAQTRQGRMRYHPEIWPDGFAPALFDLEPEPYGPFPQSLEVARGVRLIPLAGHSIGQVGVVVDAGPRPLVFTADHTLRLDWLEQDAARGRLLGQGLFFREEAIATSRRLLELDAVLLPSHDDTTPARLAAAQREAASRALA